MKPTNDVDSGSPLQIPGTDFVISADDFEVGQAPGFGNNPQPTTGETGIPEYEAVDFPGTPRPTDNSEAVPAGEL